MKAQELNYGDIIHPGSGLDLSTSGECDVEEANAIVIFVHLGKSLLKVKKTIRNDEKILYA